MKKSVLNIIAFLMFLVFVTPVSVNATVLKFAQVSDIHYEPNTPENDKGFKLKYYSLKILDDAMQQIKDEKNVKFILVTGDAADKPIAKDFDFIYKYLNKTSPKKWYYVLGNHDVSPKGLKKADQVKLLTENGQKNFSDGKTYYSFSPKRDMTFIALDANSDTKSSVQGYIPPEQLEFVDKTIKHAKNNVIVIFLHHPLTYPIAASDHKIKNDFALKEVLKKYNNPILVLGGHFHACKTETDGNIVEVASPALVSYPNAFRYITIDNKKDKTTFIIDYRETNLKDIQKIAKERLTWGYKMVYGNESDRFTTIVIGKNSEKLQCNCCQKCKCK